MEGNSIQISILCGIGDLDVTFEIVSVLVLVKGCYMSRDIVISIRHTPTISIAFMLNIWETWFFSLGAKEMHTTKCD